MLVTPSLLADWGCQEAMSDVVRVVIRPGNGGKGIGEESRELIRQRS
jgi:hypothetical protein